MPGRCSITMDRLVDRWLRRNQDGKADTAKTYAQRARSTIEEYLRWSAAPDKYDPKKRAPRANSDEPKKPQTEFATHVATVPQQPPANAPAGHEVRSCLLGQGRDPFRYVLPSDGLQVKDALRVAMHLITMCDDFDPMGYVAHTGVIERPLQSRVEIGTPNPGSRDRVRGSSSGRCSAHGCTVGLHILDWTRRHLGEFRLVRFCSKG